MTLGVRPLLHYTKQADGDIVVPAPQAQPPEGLSRQSISLTAGCQVQYGQLCCPGDNFL